MAKFQLYCDKDEKFQLELNLQETRRELINLLDDNQDCYICNRLKCAFPNESDHRYHNASPPADALPTPRWPINKISKERKESAGKESSLSIRSWIRASIPNITFVSTGKLTSSVRFPVPTKVLDVNYTWPPFPKSIWSEERRNETTERERFFCSEPEGEVNRSVEEFFRYFSEKQTIPKNAFVC